MTPRFAHGNKLALSEMKSASVSSFSKLVGEEVLKGGCFLVVLLFLAKAIG